VAKAAAVEYVRVCSTYGAGFFYIPGTETCLRVGGRVRAEYAYIEPNDRLDDSIGFRARGRIQLDARTATAYGLLRTFVRFDVTHNTGAYGGDTSTVDQAYIQFGGLTAGRTVSFFDNSDLPTGHFGTLRFSDAPTVNALAYTFSFGNGFSATLALEEGRFTGTRFIPGGTSFFTEAGQTLPDAVGNLKYSGTWGSAQISGALHQVRSADLVGPVGGPFDYPDSELGFAITAQGHINLPALGAGDALWLAATYADGALGYLGFGTSAQVGSFALPSGRLNPGILDAYVDVDGDVETSEGWSIAGGLRHYWAPTLRQNVFASYANVEYGGSADFDFNEFRVGTNVIWSPVAGLDLGVEVIYSQLDASAPFLVNGVLEDEDDAWEGRLRIQRDF
jgi:hypothetical protein